MLRALAHGGALAFGVALALTLTGCPGELHDQEAFLAAASGSCDEAGAAAVFEASCGASACHGGDRPAAALDLVSPGVGARLFAHQTTGCEEPRPLLDATDPLGSYLFEKLDPDPSCGAPMPLIGDPLGRVERHCLESFVEGLVLGAGDAGVAGSGS